MRDWRERGDDVLAGRNSLDYVPPVKSTSQVDLVEPTLGRRGVVSEVFVR